MRYLNAAFVASLVLSCASPTTSSYPTPDGSGELAAIRLNPGLRDGEVLAVRGKVVSIVSINDKPVLETIVDNHETVWIAYMYKGNPARVGDTIRVLGYSMSEAELDLSQLNIPSGALRLLAFAVMNEASNHVSYLPEDSGQQVEAWSIGVVPSGRQ